MLEPKHVASKNLVLFDGLYIPSTVYISQRDVIVTEISMGVVILGVTLAKVVYMIRLEAFGMCRCIRDGSSLHGVMRLLS